MTKISAITYVLSERPAPEDIVVVTDASDTTEASSGTTKKVTYKNFLGYTEYVALLTQSGTNAPTAVEIKNDTGATVAWARWSAGYYFATFSSAVLTQNKTIGLITSGDDEALAIVWQSTTEMVVISNNTSWNPEDSLMTVVPVIIRIYV